MVGISLPAIGWLSGALLENMPLSSLPAFNVALRATTQQSSLMIGTLTGVVLAVSAILALNRFGDDGYRGSPYRRFLRGTQMLNPHALRQRINTINRQTQRKTRKVEPVYIGTMPVPIHLENRNLLITGSIGTGKSVAIESLAASILRRRDRMVVTDPDGTLLSKFFLPGDKILNPFDTRSVGWSIFNEIQSIHDYDRIARSVIPPAINPQDEQWCEFARDIFADTLRKLHETEQASVEKLVDMLVREDGEVIKSFLSNTDSSGYFRDNAERATASVQFLMNKYVRPLRRIPEGTFSIYRWLNDPSGGNLYLTWREDMRTSLKPLVATWIDMVCSTVLSFQPMGGKRLWLLLDELHALGKLESFVPAATNGRRYGLRIVAGLQDWAQLDESYGSNAAKTILACFRNYLILGASNALNADKASEIIGDHEVERWKITQGSGSRGRSRAIVHERERVVLDAEISNLPDLSAYLLFAEALPLAKIKLSYQAQPVRVKPFEVAV